MSKSISDEKLSYLTVMPRSLLQIRATSHLPVDISAFVLPAKTQDTKFIQILDILITKLKHAHTRISSNWFFRKLVYL